MSFRKRISILIIVFSLPLYGEYYSGNSESEARIVRLPVWAFLEGQPGTMRDGEGAPFIPAKEALEETANLLLSGMSYGWRFSYTPADNIRKVSETFILESLKGKDLEKENIKIKEIRIKYPFVYCWAEYPLSETEIERHSSWNALKYKIIKGKGEGWRKDEMEGVKEAYNSAIKNALLSYAKKNLKNKPKEIKGELLIKNSPHLSISSGLFKAEVELYLNIKEIVPYTVF